MIKSNSSSTNPCGNGTTSNCVTWEGDDLECLGIEKGETISVTIKKVADEVCDLMEELDLSDFDLKCLFNFCVDCPVPAKTLRTVLELMRNKICSLEEIIDNLEFSSTTGTDPIVNLAACFQFTDADGDLITELPHTSYTKRIANQVCAILLDIASLQDDVQDLQDTVNDLQQQINDLDTNIPDVTSNCLFIGTKSIDDAWDLLDQAFCQLRTGVGSITDINLAISRQCGELATEMAGTPGWVADPSTLAQSLNNLWLAFCAQKAIVDTCCASSCNDIELGFSATLDTDAQEVTLSFTFGAGTSIPEGFVDEGSTGTITDVDGAVQSFNLEIENNAEIVVSVSSLNLVGALVIDVTAVIGNGTLTCQKCLTKTLQKVVCEFCEICVEGDEDGSMVVVYETESSTSATLFQTTTTTTTTTTSSTTTTTTEAP